MPYSLIFFDLDGTLVDSLPDIAGALNQTLGEHGLAPLPASTVMTLVGEGVRVLAERALAVGANAASASLDPGALAGRITDIYRERPCDKTTLYPGIDDVLTALRQQPDRHLVVLTNKPGDVARPLLQALGIHNHFDAIIGDGDGYPKKPDPTAILAWQKRLAIPPERTLVVGDGIPDMRVARAAGCSAAAALWGYTPAQRLQAENPRHVLENVQALLALCG